MRVPRFSVVIPAYNEAEYLGRTLESLKRQDFDGDVEVIVVDNGSTDRTADVARAHGAITLTEPRSGVCPARQLGTSAATGELVVSTDADTVHPPNWLSSIDARFREQPERVAVAGPCRFEDAPWWARIYPTLLFGIVHFVYAWTRRVLYVSATNIAFRRSAFPGYDVALTQGGDELGLLRDLRHQGDVAFDRTNIVTTSARRLRRGLLYNVLVTLLFYYVIGYVLNRLTSRTILPTAPAFRDDRPSRRQMALLIGVPVTMGCLLIWAV